MEPKRRLSDIDVQFISLVDKGANMKRIILKSDDLPDHTSLSKTVEILKTDIKKHMVFGIVYSPEETDSQGDITSPEEIEKSAHGFMKNRRIGKIDKNHNTEAGEGFVAESWITKENDSLFANDAPVGSWAVGIKIEKDETWEEIEKGDIGGLSLMGTATIEEIAKAYSWLENIFKRLGIKKGKFKDTMIASKARRMMWDITDAFSQGVNEIMSEKFKGDKKDALTKMVEELQDYIEKDFPGDLKDVAKAGRVISGSNAKKISDAISVLTQLLESSKLEKKEDSMTDEEKKALVDELKK